MITASEKANPTTIWFEGPPINFFVSKINILVTNCFFHKINVWIQIIRYGKVILESEKYRTGSGAIRSNIQFEENDTFLREYRPAIEFGLWLACLLDICGKVSVVSLVYRCNLNTIHMANHYM